MNKVKSAFTAKAVLLLLMVTGTGYAELEYVLRASKTLDSAQIVDVTFGRDNSIILVADEASEFVRVFSIEDKNLLEINAESPLRVSVPRSIMWYDELESVVLGDKDYFDKSQIVFEVNEVQYNEELISSSIPYRLVPINDGFIGVLLSIDDTGYSYKINAYTRNVEDEEMPWIHEILVDSTISTTNIYLLKSICPSVTSIQIDEREVIIVAWPSPFEYCTFNLYEVPEASGDSTRSLSGNDLNVSDYIPDPYHSWTRTYQRGPDLHTLETAVVSEEPSEWEPNNLPVDFEYRTLVDEIGTYDKQLWVLRGTQDYPVFDVYDLNSDNKPMYDYPVEFNDEEGNFPAQSEIWQYRISDEGIIAFCSNQIYVFEID